MPQYAPTDTYDTERAPSNGPCIGRCNFRYRQAVEAHDERLARWVANGCKGDEPPPVEIKPWHGEPIFCRKCAAKIRGALRELPLAYKALNAAVYLSRTNAADERRGRSDTAPSPSPGVDHQDEILRAACSWEDDLRLHLGHKGAKGRIEHTLEFTLGQAVEYLNANFQAMLERDECAKDFGEEIGTLHHVAVAMLKNKPVRRQLPSPCPTCDVTALVQEEGTAGKPWYVECNERAGGCGRLFSESEFSWLTALITGGHVKPKTAVST
jgi:hypothetical protein